MKTDDARTLAVSDVQDGVEISPPDLKPKGHPRDPAPKATPEHFPQSTFAPYRMIIPNRQVTASNIKKYLNAPSRKIIKANPRGRS
jgi:hypothetical protein